MTELDDLHRSITERERRINEDNRQVNEKLVAAYNAGYTYEEIAEVLSVTKEMVGRRLKALGVTPRPRGPSPGRPRGAP